MKSPQQHPLTNSAPLPVSQPAEEALGYESPTYGALAAEIAHHGQPPVQGYAMPAPEKAVDPYALEAPVQLLVKEAETTFKTSASYRADSGTWDGLMASAQAATAEIDAIVQTAYQLARNVSTLDARGNPLLQQWITSATNYSRNPGEAPSKLISAHFGYAVETLASDAIRGKQFQGLDVRLQVTHGSSRPDIVLVNGVGAEVAWLDITAEKSIGHIHDKASSGWATKPYIAEIVYPSLDLQADIIAGVNDPLISSLSDYFTKRSTIEKEAYDDEADNLWAAIDEFSGTLDGFGLGGNQGVKKTTTRDFLSESLGMDLGHHSLVAAKGALSFVGANPRHFGFGSEDGMSIAAAHQHVLKKAHPMARYETFELQMERISDTLDLITAGPIKTQLETEALQASQEITDDLGTLDTVEPSEMDMEELDRGISAKILAQGSLLEKVLAVYHTEGQMAGLDQVKANITSLGMIAPGLRTAILNAIDARKVSPTVHWDHNAWKQFYFTNSAIIADQRDLTALKRHLAIP